MSTRSGMDKSSSPSPGPATSRQIIGFSLPPELATDVKLEAARRRLSLRKLFEEMWRDYRAQHPEQGS